MSNSFFKIMLFFLITAQYCFSQENDNRKFQIGISGEYLLTGELNSIYDTSIGFKGQYFFMHKPNFHHFLNGSFTTDIGTTGANLYAFDLGIGTQYDIIKLWKKPLYLQLSAGGLYWQEKFSTQLIGRTINSSTSKFGFKANLGIGYRLSKKLSLQLNATQFSIKGTSIGLEIQYSF